MSRTVGIFGLGLIGMALARRLMSAGHRVIGLDPDSAREAMLVEAGGAVGTGEEVWRSDIVLSAVFSTDQLADLIGAAPILDGATCVSMSTCDPDGMAQLAAAAAKKSVTLVEAPISGTSRQVAEGTALLLLAGAPAGLDRFEDIADAISPNRDRVGAIGNGNRIKLVINLVLGLNRAAVAEGLVFAEAAGLDATQFLDIAQRSAARSEAMASKGPSMAARDFAPVGRIAQSHKDFRLIEEVAVRNGLKRLPMAGRYLELMAESLEAGEAELDNSAVYLAISRLARC